ncbi:MFS transporter [Nonomuraea sp. NPDC046802]|uniref:MFS transporter n=1 Tax=Nonomuraea sp. NPDC046802 TaxID=3154919 RepID=UPI0033D103B1
MNAVALPAGPARPPLTLSVASFVSSFDRFAVSPMLVLIAVDLNVPLSAAVAAASAYYLAYGLTQPLWGVLSDRFGRVRVMRGALFGAALAGAVSALMPVLGALVVARVVTGACFGAVIPTGLTYVGDTVQASVRQRALTDLMGAAALGTALATGLGGVLAGLVDWRVAFTVPAACALACAIALRTLPEPHRPLSLPTPTTNTANTISTQNTTPTTNTANTISTPNTTPAAPAAPAPHVASAPDDLLASESAPVRGAACPADAAPAPDAAPARGAELGEGSEHGVGDVRGESDVAPAQGAEAAPAVGRGPVAPDAGGTQDAGGAVGTAGGLVGVGGDSETGATGVDGVSGAEAVGGRGRPGVGGYLGAVLRQPWALLVFALAFVEGAIMLGALPYLPTALQYIGHPAAIAGLGITAYGLGLWAFSKVVKSLSGRWPAPLLMTVGGAHLCVGFGIVTVHLSMATVAVTALLLGGGWSFLHSSLQTWATAVVPEARGTTIAFFASALFVGSAVSSWAAGPLAEDGSYGLLFGLAAGAAVPLTAVAALTRRRYGALRQESPHPE